MTITDQAIICAMLLLESQYAAYAERIQDEAEVEVENPPWVDDILRQLAELEHEWNLRNLFR